MWYPYTKVDEEVPRGKGRGDKLDLVLPGFLKTLMVRLGRQAPGMCVGIKAGERTLDWNQGGVMVSQVRSRLSRELQR